MEWGGMVRGGDEPDTLDFHSKDNGVCTTILIHIIEVTLQYIQ